MISYILVIIHQFLLVGEYEFMFPYNRWTTVLLDTIGYYQIKKKFSSKNSLLILELLASDILQSPVECMLPYCLWFLQTLMVRPHSFSVFGKKTTTLFYSSISCVLIPFIFHSFVSALCHCSLSPKIK